MAWRYRPDEPQAHPELDPALLWTSGAVTAVVAALVALCGILVARGIFSVSLLAANADGTWGDRSTVGYVVAVALVALAATGLLHLLLLVTPHPFLFFGWIVGLLVLVAVLVPFATEAEASSRLATCLINVAVGTVIGALLAAAGRRSIRVPQNHRSPY
jgi:uncharacterized protein DUF6069